jgi:hypothetical protein
LNGYFGNLANLTDTCTSCPANSYCSGLNRLACPANTRSPALSFYVEQCRCVAGYRCVYWKSVDLSIQFTGLSTSSFNAQSGSIRTQIAAVALVPESQVALTRASVVLPPSSAPPPPPPPPSSDMRR